MSDAPYQRIAEALREQIATGSLPPGTRLPPWRALAVEHGTGQGAVRLAMEQLRREGLVEGHQRARLPVAHPTAIHTLSHPDAPWPHGHGDVETTRLVAPPHIADRLQVPHGTRVHRQRAEYLDATGRPSHLITTWYRGRLSTGPSDVTLEIESRQLTNDEAQALGLPRDTHAFLLIRTHTRPGPSRQPLDTADMLLPTDRWRLRFSSNLMSVDPSVH